jgi:hypothetical protein
MKKIFSHIKFVLCLGIILSSVSSCFKDKELYTEYPTDPWANDPKVKLDVSGEIIDEAGNPVKDALITSGDKTYVTDKNGVFVIKNCLQNPNFIYVKAEKKGYFNGARVIRGAKNRNNTIKIALVKKAKVASFASSKGLATKVGDMNIKFPENGYVDAQGKNYSGNINVFAKYLNPSLPQTLLEMPGDLRAVNFEGQEKFLESYGMVYVEMEDDAGNLLNLGNGGEAEMSFPKPNNSTARVSMPLWYFDEKVGAWREEGIATLDDKAKYVGKVKHFSCWNCDFPYDKVFAQGRIVNQNGKPLANAWIGLDLVGSWQGGHGNTDANGVFMGCIPKGVELELKVRIYSPDGCVESIFTQKVGPFDKDVDLGTITVNVPVVNTPDAKSIIGNVKDCSGANLKNGYVTAKFIIANGVPTFNVVLFTDTLGNFTYDILGTKCLSSADITRVEIQAYDLPAKKESLLKSYTLEKGKNDLGSIEVCSTVTTFVDFKFNDSTLYTILPFQEIFMTKDSMGTKEVLEIVLGGQSVVTKAVGLVVEVTSNPPVAGTYPAKCTYAVGLYPQNLYPDKTKQNITINLTEVSLKTGEYVAGTLSGSFSLNNGQVVNVNGSSFRVKKN